MTTETKEALKVLERMKVRGGIAELRKARKGHKCAGCGWPIEKGQLHYCFVYSGSGLGGLKFPEHYHVGCLERED